MDPKERETKVKALTNAQAISIARLIKDTIVVTRLPKDYSAEIDNINAADAIYELCKQSDYEEIDKEQIDRLLKEADENAVGSAAKDFLLFVADTGDKELIQQLDEELTKPPDELVAVIEPLSFLAVIFGGIALLNVVSNVQFKNGKFEYDSKRGSEATKQSINGVVKVIKAMIPFGSNKK
jgi:hypothetical protein